MQQQQPNPGVRSPAPRIRWQRRRGTVGRTCCVAVGDERGALEEQDFIYFKTNLKRVLGLVLGQAKSGVVLFAGLCPWSPRSVRGPQGAYRRSHHIGEKVWARAIPRVRWIARRRRARRVRAWGPWERFSEATWSRQATSPPSLPGCIPSPLPCVHASLRVCSAARACVLRGSNVRPGPGLKIPAP